MSIKIFKKKGVFIWEIYLENKILFYFKFKQNYFLF